MLFPTSLPLTQTRLLICLCGPLPLRCPSCPQRLHLTETFSSLCAHRPSSLPTPSHRASFPMTDCPQLLLESWSQVSLSLFPSPPQCLDSPRNPEGQFFSQSPHQVFGTDQVQGEKASRLHAFTLPGKAQKDMTTEPWRHRDMGARSRNP